MEQPINEQAPELIETDSANAPAAPEQPAGLDVTQLMFDSLVIIEESINRGTFKANELSGVMRVYDQLADLKKQIAEQGAK